MVRAHTPANHHHTNPGPDLQRPDPDLDPASDDGLQRNELLAFALTYAAAGWPIFPLRPGTKRPACPDHPAHACTGTDPRCAGPDGHKGWEQRATTDTARIRAAWERTPWGIGIACGPAGLIVVDLDTAKAGCGITGAESLRQLETDQDRQLPATYTVATPTGGRHLYYQQPPGHRIRNSAGTVAPGIDIRAAGGYVAAPPTITTTGTYVVIDDTWPPTLPNWFAELLNPPPRPTPTRPAPNPPVGQGAAMTGDRLDRYVHAAVTGEIRNIYLAPEGQRNHRLFCAAVALGQLVAADTTLTLNQAEDLLAQAAGRHVHAGAYTTGQATQTIASGLNRGLNEPRQLPATTGATQ